MSLLKKVAEISCLERKVHNVYECYGKQSCCFSANVTDAELARLSEELWRLEGPNNCADLIRVNLQSRTSYGATVDQASQP